MKSVGISMNRGASLKDIGQTEKLGRREEELQAGRGGLEDEPLGLDREDLSLRRENLHLRRELANLQQAFQALQRQQEQLLILVERYKRLLQECRGFMPPVDADFPRED
jgi:flagellar motility protein MotE (MotC chaperone)